jgi:ketosteroid isomerase-like protein
MPQENMANIERGYEAMSRLDAEALVALCESDVEFRSRVGEADDVTYHGHDGVRDYIATLSEVFEWVRTEPLEVIDGGDWAVVCNRFRARGRLSEVEVEDHFFQAMRLRNGKALWWAFYPSKAEALEAVGLSEPTRQGGENPEPRA